MHDHTGMPLREDRMVAVLAVGREAFLTAFEQALHVLVAEVPAAVALAQAAAERAHVADLRPGDVAGGGGQGREVLPQPRMAGDGAEGCAGADVEGRTALSLLDGAEALEGGEADDAGGLGD